MMTKLRPVHGVLVLAAALGCQDEDDGTTTAEDPAMVRDGDVGCFDVDAGAREDGGVDTGPLGDAASAAVLVAANLGEVEQGLLAVALAQDPDVRTFARHMVLSHQEALERQSELLREAKLSPMPNPTSATLRAAAEDTVTRLTGASGGTFDVAYTRAQIDMHGTLLALLDDRLIPDAESAAWSAEVKATRAVVDSHLREARALLDSLDGTGSGARDGGVQDAGSDDAHPWDAGMDISLDSGIGDGGFPSR